VITTGSVLDAVEHSRIIQDFENVCTTAGIQGHFLREPLAQYCGDVEVDWVRKFRKYRAEGLPGLVLAGVKRPEVRCQAIAAAFVRNYIDARVTPLNTIIDSTMDGGHPASPTVLLIPNLYMTVLSGKFPAWRVQVMYDLLLERSIKEKPTVVYVETLEGVAGLYGTPFREFLDGFKLVTE